MPSGRCCRSPCKPRVPRPHPMGEKTKKLQSVPTPTSCRVHVRLEAPGPEPSCRPQSLALDFGESHLDVLQREFALDVILGPQDDGQPRRPFCGPTGVALEASPEGLRKLRGGSGTRSRSAVVRSWTGLAFTSVPRYRALLASGLSFSAAPASTSLICGTSTTCVVRRPSRSLVRRWRGPP